MSAFSGRNKTLKRTHDISGDIISVNTRKTITFDSDTLMNFLDLDAGGAYKRQWHRLERGLRLNRLRKFAEEEAGRLHLSDTEKQNLYNLLAKSLDKKQIGRAHV